VADIGESTKVKETTKRIKLFFRFVQSFELLLESINGLVDPVDSIDVSD
jgi:hypothetical protein